jgi:hypothetical protein
VLALALPAACSGGQEALRGPRGVRDEFLPAQSRLTLPATAPGTLGPGRSLLRLSLDWGNDFARDQDGPGEAPRERRFLVDGEHATLELECRRGLGAGWEAGLRLPLRWRGAGALDALIDGFHGLTKRLGLPDNDRSLFRRGLYRVEVRSVSGEALVLDGAGGGLGNLELGGRRALGRRAALVARLALPTGTGPFDAAGVGLAMQLVAARAAGAWELGGGIGVSHESDAEVQGFRYARTRAQGFAAADWRLARRFSLIGETTLASRLLTNVARYPGLVWYLALGGRLDLDGGLSIEAGFTENIADQQATSDVGFQLALIRRP